MEWWLLAFAIPPPSQVPVSKFHELRYNVALILKEMNNLEKRSILQIQDWEAKGAAAEKLVPSLLMITAIPRRRSVCIWKVFELLICWLYHLKVDNGAAEDEALRHTLCAYIDTHCIYINTYLSKHLNSKCISVCPKLNILVSLRHSRLVQKTSRVPSHRVLLASGAQSQSLSLTWASVMWGRQSGDGTFCSHTAGRRAALPAEGMKLSIDFYPYFH